jgi:arylsulfatase A-like enzyme
MNVVVLAAHGLNCHWLGPYGNEWISTPAVDSLACESIVFDQHFANDPSPAGFLLSCPPPLAGVARILVDDRKTAPADAREWDQVFRTEPTNHPTPAKALISAVRKALDALKPHSQCLLWIETDRLVPPWDFEFETYQEYAESSEGFIESREAKKEEPIDEPTPGPIGREDDGLWHRLHNSFAAAVTSFDAEVKDLVSLFRRRGLDNSAAWILTSGYGWPLGEHGIVGTEGSRLHEELVHVPLIVRLPDAREAMRRLPTFTQTNDLMPTLHELLGRPSEGASLLPLIEGKIESIREDCRISRDGERALRTSEWAFLAATETEPARLYLKPDDIWETNDLAARHPDECDQLLARLDFSPQRQQDHL